MIETVKAALTVTEALIKKTERSIDPNLTGTLIKPPKGKTSRPYYKYQKIINGKPRRFYLGKKDSAKLRRFVENQFRIKRLELLKANKFVLEDFLAGYREYGVSEVYNLLSGAYSELPRVAFVDRRFQEIWDWAHEPYEKNLRKYPNAVNKSKLGERTRSKGETILHNEIIARGIPFRYDGLLVLEDIDGTEVDRYPDYLFLCYDGSMIAIEHLGRLDRMGYALETAEKLRVYLLNGFVLGVNLFLTSDDKDHGMDSQVADNILALVERRFYGL